MSKVSDISRQYQSALSTSQTEYEDMYRERAEATQKFYQDFFHQLIVPFGNRFQNQRFRARLQELIERQLGTRQLNFVAIDGTCRQWTHADFVTFFGGAYGARGSIDLGGGQHKIQYNRWSLDQDVSMVAWVPIPFARLSEVSRPEAEEFLITEEERFNLASIHVQVMQLAEIFLAYNTVTASRLEAPQILMMDLSPSSVLASVAHSQDNVGLVGYPYDRRSLTSADITIALSHPYSDTFGIPSPKRMDLHRIILASLQDKPESNINLGRIAQEYNVSEDELRRSANYLVRQGVLKHPSESQSNYSPSVRVDQSWAYVREFFQNICSKLFIQKDANALQYDILDEYGVKRRRWMAPDDLGFLIAVGMRLLIEACWERNVLLYGIVKDSSSRYLTRNYLGVTLETGFYPELQDIEIGMLPWTDRIFCELLPLVDDSLTAPWSTIEFDSAFMTLHREKTEDLNGTQVAGVMGRIVNQERLFTRSLGQFFLKRDKQTPLMGHVIFLERLLHPVWDNPENEQGPTEIMINTPSLGHFSVFAWRNRDDYNTGQWIMMYLLSVLTRNHYAEAIGYPDPLHKADWGAKSVGRSVAKIVASSAQYLRSKPLSQTFRQIRDSARR